MNPSLPPVQTARAPRADRQRRNHSHGFTLLELLLVCALIAVVVGMMVPVVGQLGKSQSLSNAGNHMTDMLTAARQNSMTKNCLTVLIIPTGANQNNGCILYELLPKADGSAPTQTDWQPASKWEMLPNGVVIDTTTFVSQSSSSSLPAPLPAIKRGNTTISQYCFVTFMPRGIPYPKTLPSGGNPYIRLVKGISHNGKIVVQGPSKDGTAADSYKIIVLSATGITKIERS